MTSIEIPQGFHDLIKKWIIDHDKYDTVDEFVARAAAEKLQRQVKENYREQGTFVEGRITEEERDLHRQLVDLGVIERDPVLLDEVEQ